MNVLQIASNMKRNGPAMVVFDLSYGLAEMGHIVYIAAGEGELVKEINHPNIHFVHIPIDRIRGSVIKRIGRYTINAVKTYSMLKKLIRKNNIQIINSHQPISNMYAKKLSRTLHIPFVTTSHNVYEKGFFSNTYASGDHVVACGDKVYENSIKKFKVSEDRITCIRNGINPERLVATSPISYDGKYVIGALAGLRKQKSLSNLIKSFAQLKQKIDGACLVIAGDGEEREYLESLVSKLNLQDSVHFLGFRNDSANVLAGLDVFALSSKYEGLPISMLEAMAMKVPVVVTSVGSIPWVIKDKENGMLCDYGNVQQMADIFERLYIDEPLRKRLGNAAYQTIYEKYSYLSMSQQYLKIYELMISNK